MCRKTIAAALTVMVGFLLLTSSLASSASAQTLVPPLPGVSPHDDGDKDQGGCVGPTMLCLAEDPGGVIGGITGDLVDSAGGALLQPVVDWVSAGAAVIVQEITRRVQRSSSPDLAAPLVPSPVRRRRWRWQ